MMAIMNLSDFAGDGPPVRVTRLPTREEALTLAADKAAGGYPEVAQVWLAIADRVTPTAPPAPDVIGQEALIDCDGDFWVKHSTGYQHSGDDDYQALAYIEEEWGPVRHVRIVEVS